jgi:hypothetical protein
MLIVWRLDKRIAQEIVDCIFDVCFDIWWLNPSLCAGHVHHVEPVPEQGSDMSFYPGTNKQLLVVNHVYRFLYAYKTLTIQMMQCLFSDCFDPIHIIVLCSVRFM